MSELTRDDVTKATAALERSAQIAANPPMRKRELIKHSWNPLRYALACLFFVAFAVPAFWYAPTPSAAGRASAGR